MKNIDLLLEQYITVTDMMDKHNEIVDQLDERKKKECRIHYTDSLGRMRTKCGKAYKYGTYYYPFIRYVLDPKPTPTPPPTDDTQPDSDAGDGGDTGDGTDTGGDAGGVSEALIEAILEAKSSTERVRKYYRKHPEKVRAYLKKTVKDRAARNRDRRKAVKKYGKKKMKNHDVHHPNGPNGGSWRLAKKDHGPDKKNKNESYIMEGGAAGHLAHPYEDTELTFGEFKQMINKGLMGSLDNEAPTTEKLDGQNIAFTVRDGVVKFARNKGHVKNRGQTALTAQELADKFGGRGGLETSFTATAEDIQAALERMPQSEIDKIFGDGRRFMNTEIIFSDTENVIPYDKNVLVFHGTIEYDDDGNEVSRSIDHGQELANSITKLGASQQKTFELNSPVPIAFSDEEDRKYETLSHRLEGDVSKLQEKYDLSDDSTLGDYMLLKFREEVDAVSERTQTVFTKQEKEGLARRWALDDKSFKLTELAPEKRDVVRMYEQDDLKDKRKEVVRPLESTILMTGTYAIKRATNLLSAHNPVAAAKLTQAVKDAIENIRNSKDEDKIEKLNKELERLDSLGMDDIVPSEGIVFVHKGKPYKFTGKFAPINQIIGTLKFDKPTEKTDEPKPPSEKKVVAIFTGRFQPFHAGHYSVYKNLVGRFGKDNVYIATTDKKDAIKSPFGFDEKQQIMTTMFDIPEDKVVKVQSPYKPVEILSKLPDDTVYVTAVSEKDAERLRPGQTYFKKYDDTSKEDLTGYKDAGYVVIAPEAKVDVGGKNISGTQLRAFFGDPDTDVSLKKKMFDKLYPKHNDSIFNLVVQKTKDAETVRKSSDTSKSVSKSTDSDTKSSKKTSVDDIPSSKREKMDFTQRVYNPLTKRKIHIKSALSYPKDHPVYKAAMKQLKQK